MNNTNIASESGLASHGLYWPVAIVLAVLIALLWLMGFGPGGSACSSTRLASVEMNGEVSKFAEPPAIAAVSAPGAESLSVPSPENIYFQIESAELSEASTAQLSTMVAYLKANSNAKVALSGFHDASGNRAANEELALDRARAVRSALEAAGILKDRVVMSKPAETIGKGSPEEARRVEVSVLP